MSMKKSFCLLFFFLSTAAIVQGKIAVMDEYWTNRQAEAQKQSEAAYNPNPEQVTDQVNKQVGKALMATNGTRRNLRAHNANEPCKTTNPIDKRWRCDPNWANDRKKLVRGALGFGHLATGGAAGKYYTVTDASDGDMLNPKPGTLRHAVIQKEPLWIIFARSMIIKLEQELIMARLVQRMPRCRYGFIHVVNNDYTHWLMYAIGGSSNPTIISQGNRFIAPPNLAAKEITKREYVAESEWKNWIWKSEGDLMMNGAFFVESGAANSRSFSRLDMIKYKPGTFVTRLTRFAGALGCHPGKPC
ncbi:hypothetical protein ACFE04_023708 [Oxalis oulophora]